MTKGALLSAFSRLMNVTITKSRRHQRTFENATQRNHYTAPRVGPWAPKHIRKSAPSPNRRTISPRRIPPVAVSTPRTKKRAFLQDQLRVTLQNKSLLPGSIRQYNSAFRTLLKFGASVGFAEEEIWPTNIEVPLNNQVVFLWIIELIDKGVPPNSIASKISALKWFCDINFRTHDLASRTVARLMGAAARYNSKAQDKAKPITPSNMRTFHEICTGTTAEKWMPRMLVIVALCFAGFLRIMECLAIRLGHVTFTDTHMMISIPARKGDRYRLGSKVRIARQHGSRFCVGSLTEACRG